MKLILASPIFWLAKKVSELFAAGSDPADKPEAQTEVKELVEVSEAPCGNIEEENKIAAAPAPQQEASWKSLEDTYYRDHKKWCDHLADLIGKIDLETYKSHSRRGEYFHLSEGLKTTTALSNYVYKNMSHLAAQFNDSAQMHKSAKRVRLTITEHTIYDPTVATGKKKTSSNSNLLSEFRITSATRSLSIRCEPGKLFAFLLPANVNLDLKNNETSDRLKLAIVLDSTGGERNWTVNGLPVSEDEITYLAKALLRDLVILSCLDYLAYDSGKKFEHVDNIHRIGIARGYKDSLSLGSELSSDLVKDLVFAQQNTVQKLLRQQEETQASIARDLHDTVLADLMMLVRRLTSEQEGEEEEGQERAKDEEPETIDKEMILDTLDEISVTIRDICQGLVPRDLKDWGLETVLEDLVDKAAERVEADFAFSVEGNIPDLPSAIQLHIFRIVQEALNNIEKYSEARNVKVRLKREDELFTIEVSDDGKGFDSSETGKDRATASSGGFGLPSINERLEIIRAYYPARLKIESSPGQGTSIKLEITVESFK
ncbi:MAG: sensor histidine kinase [Cyanobacteriota/Melainabacteria group bacterium]